jgi:hypothetical protein
VEGLFFVVNKCISKTNNLIRKKYSEIANKTNQEKKKENNY